MVPDYVTGHFALKDDCMRLYFAYLHAAARLAAAASQYESAGNSRLGGQYRADALAHSYEADCILMKRRCA
jgi:hypothetical protein